MEEDDCPRCGSKDIILGEVIHFCKDCKFEYRVKEMKYLSEEEFHKFKTNDFHALKDSVNFIRGQLYVLIPVILSILGLVIYLVV